MVSGMGTSHTKRCYYPTSMKSEIHIASPCSADWNKMAGDARGRHCAECNLDVYNFSEMSDADILRIIAEREGRLCARFYQRSDGNMLTQDCPAGFRAVARRLSRFASAALAAAMSMAPAFAGPAPRKSPTPLFQIQPIRTGLSVQVVDASGGALAHARVTAVNEKTKAKFDGETDENGRLRLADMPAGSYEITVVFPNFNTLKRNHVSMPSQTELKLQLDLAALMGVVTIVSEPQPETAVPPVSKKLSDPPPAKPK